MDPSKCGRRYWRIALTDGNEVYAHADNVSITESGGIILVGNAERSAKPYALLAFNAGEWRHYWAASLFDGVPVSVEHWPGVVEGDTEGHLYTDAGHGGEAGVPQSEQRTLTR